MTSPLLTLLLHRATYLAPVLAAGLLIGEPWAKLLGFRGLRAKIGAHIQGLGSKLNRPSRNTATRLYRGIVAVCMLLLPTIALGVGLMQPVGWVQLLSTLLLVALFGELMRTHTAYRLRRARDLALQSAAPHYLFADSHGQLRYHILAFGERFALLVGACTYYLIADLPGMLCYLTIAASAQYYPTRLDENRAFGWAACGLFALLDPLPRLIACLLLWLAAFFVPHARPFGTLWQLPQRFHGWLAALLGLSLGGPMPSPAGEFTLPWSGEGNPKPNLPDLSRGLKLVLVASLLLLLLLGSSIYSQ